ncbi:hypothetical protein MBLNU230_g7528t1 [Neophaeotheca triangularis]
MATPQTNTTPTIPSSLPAATGLEYFHRGFTLIERDHPILGTLPFARKVEIVNNDRKHPRESEHDINISATGQIVTHIDTDDYLSADESFCVPYMLRRCLEQHGIAGSIYELAVYRVVDAVARREQDPQRYVPALYNVPGLRLAETCIPLFMIHEVVNIEQPALGPMRRSCSTRPRTITTRRGNVYTEQDLKAGGEVECRLVRDGEKTYLLEIYNDEEDRLDLVEDFAYGMAEEVRSYEESRAGRIKVKEAIDGAYAWVKEIKDAQERDAPASSAEGEDEGEEDEDEGAEDDGEGDESSESELSDPDERAFWMDRLQSTQVADFHRDFGVQVGEPRAKRQKR